MTSVSLGYGSTLVFDSNALSSGSVSVSSGDFSTSGYGNFYATVVLNAETFQQLILAHNSESPKSLVTFQGNTSKIGVGSNYISSSSSGGLYGTWNDGSPTYGFQDVSTQLYSLFTSKEYKSIAFSLVLTSSGTQIYLSLVDEYGNEEQLYGSASGLKSGSFGQLSSISCDSSYITYISLSDEDVSSSDFYEKNKAAIAASQIPEPATVSLSLISLAALMMRRRRA